MRCLPRLVVTVLGVLAFVGCGFESYAPSGDGGADATTRVDAGSGGAGGDCTTSADCGGAPCVAIVPGGFRVCAPVPPEATSCVPARPTDQCCTSADCAATGGGRCYFSNGLPFCGGAVPAPANICFSDNCTRDEDCFGGTTGEAACVPAGVSGFPGRACLMTFCRRDADCTAEPGGVCATVRDACCGLVAGLACVYRSGCRTNADCEAGSCVLDTARGIGRCEPGGVPCPLAAR